MNREVLLPLDTPLGDTYWTLMSLAGDYAYAGREWVARKVVALLGGAELELVHNHHNFAWKEDHGEGEVVVVRKGSTPAFEGQLGFVGGSMGDNSVILRGTSSASASHMFSTVHGAGRVMGRMEAKGKWKKGRCVRPGRVSHEDMARATEGVVVRGGDLDEAPQVYRQLSTVLAQQPGIEIIRTLTPLVVCMAPARTVDPYMD
jgi:tRNA-splicing ligase RtcB